MFMQKTEKYQRFMNQAIQAYSASIKNLEHQVSQIAMDVNDLKSQASGRLPSQPVVNPREHVNAIILKSGNKVEGLPPPPPPSMLRMWSNK